MALYGFWHRPKKGLRMVFEFFRDFSDCPLSFNVFLPVTFLMWVTYYSQFPPPPYINHIWCIINLWSKFICLLHVRITKSEWRLICKFPCRWCTVRKVLQPMGSKNRCLKKCPKPCWPIRSKVKATIYTSLTLLSHPSFAFTGRNKFFFQWKIRRAP